MLAASFVRYVYWGLEAFIGAGGTTTRDAVGFALLRSLCLHLLLEAVILCEVPLLPLSSFAVRLHVVKSVAAVS
jgi:hypothetical protein